MAHSVEVRPIGPVGVPVEEPVRHAFEGEREAIAVAAPEVELDRPELLRVATVFDGVGRRVLIYAGPGGACDGR